MSTQTEQRYIVHLDIQATALDRTDAVEEVLEQVRLGELGTFAYSVEEIGNGADSFPIPAQHLNAAETLDRPWGRTCRPVDNRYHGEFLG